MICEYTKDSRELLIKFSGEIDHYTCEAIKRESDYEIQKCMPKMVVFDFKNVKFREKLSLFFNIIKSKRGSYGKNYAW